MTYPRLSISEVTTYFASFKEDVAAYAEAGAEGIGIWEFKLKDMRDEDAATAVRDAGLTATLCCPEVPSVIPDPYFAEPKDPEARVEAMCAAVKRLARFDPLAILVVSGDPREHDPAWARQTIVNGLRRVAAAAAEAGVTIGLEPLRRTSGSLITTLPETVELIEEIGAPNISIIADVWHFWDLPNIEQDLRTYVDRLIGVQLNDYRQPTRSWCDRILPGDGAADFRSIFGALESAGYRGWYDVEIFSDNGIFGNDYPDSLWDVEPRELARQSVQRFRALWDSAISARS